MPNRVGVTYSNELKVLPYERALREVGLEPVRLHPEDQALASLDGLDGLLVSGGADIDPSRYQQARHAETEAPEVARDEMEMRLLSQALAGGIPVLAICRGMQLFNVLHQGSLEQHIASSDKHRVRELTAHQIQVEAGTKLAELVGPGTQEVNSRHHQAVDRVGDGLRVSARSDDGIVEGLERSDLRFAVAVQWHPEDRIFTSESDRKLFEGFARAVGS